MSFLPFMFCTRQSAARKVPKAAFQPVLPCAGDEALPAMARQPLSHRSLLKVTALCQALA